jgi:hypothetical protein
MPAPIYIGGNPYFGSRFRVQGSGFKVPGSEVQGSEVQELF